MRAVGVVVCIRDGCVHSGAGGSSGSFWFVGFIRARLVGRRVQWSALMESSGSFGFVGFIWSRSGRRWQARPRCGLVHSGSLGAFVRALPVLGFIRVSWVVSGAPLGSSGSFGLVGSIWARPGGRLVYEGSLGLFGAALGSSGSFWLVGFMLAHPGRRLVHWRSLWASSGTFVFI